MESANTAAAAAPPRTKYGRRQYLIDRGFQLKYTIILVLVGAAISLLFGAMMYQAHVEATQLMDLPAPYKEVIATQDNTLLWLVMAIAVVMALALGLFGVLVTHRVAGPIYVFSHYLNILGQGRYPQLRPLRKGDELKDFYEIFHEAVSRMKARDKDDGTLLLELAKQVESGADTKAAAEKLRALGNRLLEASASADPATPGQKAEAAQAAP
jgi:hypothetical protein